MSVTSPDFESGAYTNFATPAFGADNNKASLDSNATFHVVRVVPEFQLSAPPQRSRRLCSGVNFLLRGKSTVKTQRRVSNQLPALPVFIWPA